MHGTCFLDQSSYLSLINLCILANHRPSSSKDVPQEDRPQSPIQLLRPSTRHEPGEEGGVCLPRGQRGGVSNHAQDFYGAGDLRST